MIIFYTKIIVFSKKNQCFHTSPYIDDNEKNRKIIVFLFKINIFSIQNHRFCCSRCIDEAKNVAKSFIFIENSLKNSLFFKEKIMFSRIPVYGWSPQKSLIFHFSHLLRPPRGGQPRNL